MLLHLLVILSCIPLFNAVVIQNLTGEWTLSDASGQYKNLPATVPGGVYSALQENNIINNILSGYNDTETRWVANTSWIYTLNFTVDDGLFQKSSINLVFEGLDTFTTISLNGQTVGATENMFRRYVLDVKNATKTGENQLEVTFYSPILKAAELSTQQDYAILPNCPPSSYNGECHVNTIRKMQASFGSDWAPAFPSMGIWRNVFLEGFNVFTLRDTIFKMSDIEDENFFITLDSYLSCPVDNIVLGRLTYFLQNDAGSIMLSIPINNTYCETKDVKVSYSFRANKLFLGRWWPNGYGRPTRYYISANIQEEDEVIFKTIYVGFRTIELIQDPDPTGTGTDFYLKVNGVPIFAKGANLVPLHILPELGQDPDDIDRLLNAVKDANMNMLRVWGGGVYQSDYFYEKADELGILIWQDCMFSRALYPADSAFLSNVKEEIEYQVKRLSYHPSVAIWSANSENEVGLMANWWGPTKNQTNYKEDYLKLYQDVILETLNETNPNLTFVSSSPSNGVKTVEDGYLAQNPQNASFGDVHFYNFLLNSLTSKTYPIPRFASEYGYQSMPEVASWLTVTDNLEDLSPSSPFMHHRRHNSLGLVEMTLLLYYQFYLNTTSPSYYKTHIYYSQVLQAWSTKFETEYYRSYMGRYDGLGQGNTMGALFWQLNDVWVAPTWSSIGTSITSINTKLASADFTGKWKMLQYLTKDFFATTIVTGYLNAENMLKIYIVSDERSLIQGSTLATVQIDVYNWGSFQIVNSTLVPLNLTYGVATELASFDTDSYLSDLGCGSPEESRTNCFVYLSLRPNQWVSAPSNFVIPAPIKNTKIVNTIVKIAGVVAIGTTNQLFQVVVETSGISLFVWLDSHEILGRFSENGFIQITPRKIITFQSEDPHTSGEVQRAFTVTHLRDAEYL